MSAAGSEAGANALARRAVARARVRDTDAVVSVGEGALSTALAAALAERGLRVASAPATGDVADAPRGAVVFETTGDPAVVRRLLESAPLFTRILLLGAGNGRRLDVDLYRTVHQRGLEVIGVADPEATT